jgi:hypothetical protein
MRNELVITGTETQLLLSQTDDGTNTLFINGVEVPQSVWVGTSESTFAEIDTATGEHVMIRMVENADSNLMLTRINEDMLFVYEFVPYVPFDPSDIGNSLVQLNQRVSDLEKAEPYIHVLQGSYTVQTDGEQHIAVPLLGYDGDGQDLMVDINGLVCVLYVDYMFSEDGKYLDFSYGLKTDSVVHVMRPILIK